MSNGQAPVSKSTVATDTPLTKQSTSTAETEEAKEAAIIARVENFIISESVSLLGDKKIS